MLYTEDFYKKQNPNLKKVKTLKNLKNMNRTIRSIYKRTDFEQFKKINEEKRPHSKRHVIDLIDNIIEEEIAIE